MEPSPSSPSGASKDSCRGSGESRPAWVVPMARRISVSADAAGRLRRDARPSTDQLPDPFQRNGSQPLKVRLVHAHPGRGALACGGIHIRLSQPLPLFAVIIAVGPQPTPLDEDLRAAGLPPIRRTNNFIIPTGRCLNVGRRYQCQRLIRAWFRIMRTRSASKSTGAPHFGARVFKCLHGTNSRPLMSRTGRAFFSNVLLIRRLRLPGLV
jgi:hypothetical protein